MVLCWVTRAGFSTAAFGWMAGIFYWSSLSGDALNNIRLYDLLAFAWLGSLRSIVAHLLVFGVLSSLIQATIWRWRANGGYTLPAALLAAILAAGYGVTDEVHQYFTVGRSASFADMLTDAIGALAATMLLHFTVSLLRPPLGSARLELNSYPNR